MYNLFWVGLGGAIGSSLRYLIGNLIALRHPSKFHWGTLLINLTGSFILGIIYGLPLVGNTGNLITKFVGVGILGAYTTFSTFGYETIRLIESKQLRLAALYVISSVVGGTSLAYLGIQIAEKFH